ncbi:MAG TPA: phosphoribosylamine--glycine ligase [Bacteroidetes bacterium]|nr:phosphoribosylamine--glycine ligase [Bacteroidota bacterium]
MNSLILGSGGREHAFAWKISQSPLNEQLFIAPGNAGTAQYGTNISLDILDFPAIAAFCLENAIGFLLPGGEDTLVAGIVDYFKNDPKLRHIHVAGPEKAGAMLEGSKDFAKAFMARHHIPTAAYKTFNATTLEEGKAFLENLEAPYVLKADGLAAGKGVVIPETLEEAKAELHAMLADAKFGAASARVVIEEFLKGIEVSVFVLSDGKNYAILPEAKDYKRIGEGDTGLNTGGMGAISPVPFVDASFLQKVEERIIKPTISGLQKDGIDYRGFIFLGLMNVGGDPFVIEYNVRMGDPETETVLPRLESDLLELLLASCEQTLGTKSIKISPKTSATVVLVSGGYPESYAKGKIVQGLDHPTPSMVFHSGTKKSEDGIVTNGGRVFAINSLADTLENALADSFATAEQLIFEGKYYRRDIGKDLIKLRQS